MLDAFSDVGERECTSMQQAEAETSCDQLLDNCTLEASREGEDELPLDSERLDSMATRIAKEARMRSRNASASGNDGLAAMLDDLVRRLSAADCGRCANLGESTGPCGEEVDHGLVERRGECLTDLKDIYGFSVSLGSALYSDAWNVDGPVDRVGLKLRTRSLAPTSVTGGHARLSARTDFEKDGSRHHSVVTLDIDGSRYGTYERDAAAYYLIHEIVAHAFYDAFAPLDRAHCDPFDLWSEGWMDCVAEDLLKSALAGDHPSSSAPPPRLRANQIAIDAVSRSHAGRYETPQATRSHRLNGMRLARARYGAMRYRLRSLDPSSGFNAMRIVHLACAIVNAKGAANATVAAINAGAAAFSFGAKAGGPLSAEERRFYAGMSSFVAHRDESRLIRELK